MSSLPHQIVDNKQIRERILGIIAFMRTLALRRDLTLTICHTAKTDGHNIYLPLSMFVGAYNRPFALGLTAHEVGHCLYTDFEVLTQINYSVAQGKTDIFALKSQTGFTLPLLHPDGSVSSYKLKSRFYKQIFANGDCPANGYEADCAKLINESLNALEDARIEKRLKEEIPETAYVLDAVYTQLLHDACKPPENPVNRYVFFSCLCAHHYFSNTLKQDVLERFFHLLSKNDAERQLLHQVRQLLHLAVAYAQHNLKTSFLSATSGTASLAALTVAVADLFMRYAEDRPDGNLVKKRGGTVKIGPNFDYDHRTPSPQELIRKALCAGTDSSAMAEVKDLVGISYTVTATQAPLKERTYVRMPLQEVTTENTQQSIPKVTDLSQARNRLQRILYPQGTTLPPSANCRSGIRFDLNKVAPAALGQFNSRIFKRHCVTRNDGLTHIAVILDTSSSTKKYRSDYLKCAAFLQQVLAGGPRLLSSMYCFDKTGVARIKRVREPFSERILRRISYSGMTPGFAALHYAVTELLASKAERKLLLCLSDGEFNDSKGSCAYLDDWDAIREEIKLVTIFVKEGCNCLPHSLIPDFKRTIDHPAALPQTIVEAVAALY